MGGQVSDTGYIYNDSLKVLVEDLFISPNKEHVHIVNVEEGVIHVHDKVTARINVKRRNAIEKNHSATHLLHQALKEALDYEVLQAGSKVTEKELRFDFTYPKKITDEDICIIENLVNEKIQTKVDAKTDIMSLDEAVKSGAVHQFDEKYDKLVRVVTLYNSVELCGGTHVKNLGDINKFAIYNIESKGADVYRIEATTDTNIERVLFNLISNAINHSGKDEQKKIIKIRVTSNTKFVKTEVIDNGIGIKQEDIKHIWDRYYKVNKNFKRSDTGSGLGLSIVKDILIAHNCNYGVKSKENEGANFWFELYRANKPKEVKNKAQDSKE